MHIRGKYQCLELIYPSNPSKVMKREMINCAQLGLQLAPGLQLRGRCRRRWCRPGTIIHIISWHDNSAGNRHNPDPKNWVGYGQRTIDDMGFAWIGWVDLTQEEYEQEVAARAAKQKLAPATK